jgi:hypothetical protein
MVFATQKIICLYDCMIVTVNFFLIILESTCINFFYTICCSISDSQLLKKQEKRPLNNTVCITEPKNVQFYIMLWHYEKLLGQNPKLLGHNTKLLGQQC